jgi:beta-xylosidase
MYYLFVSYDWLEDNYNVRVGRSENPEGPYLDILGNDLGQAGDNYPMITARYRFENHPGWQGLGHCGVIRDKDRYFFVSQGRLGSNKYLMNLHVRRMFWSPDGWPMGGALGSVENGSWDFDNNLLTLSFPDQPSFSCRVFQEWDWENEKLTIAYTGMNSEGRCVWGKKRDISK